MKEDTRRGRSKSASAIPDVRLAIIGGASVGKSAISVRFLTKRFIGEYQRNVENTYRRNIQYENNIIEYDLRDTAGILDRLTLINWSTCIAVVYSITDQQSFQSAHVILKEINGLLNLNGPQFLKPCIALIANKSDLHHLREVTTMEGEKLGKKFNVAFWEVSASADYSSTYAPLNSLIVESYIKVVTARNTDCNTASHSTKSLEEKPRTYSETFTSMSQRSSRSSLDSDYGDLDYRTLFGKHRDEDSLSVTSTSSLKDLLRKRKTSQHERTLETLNETCKQNSHFLSTEQISSSDMNNNVLNIPEDESIIKSRSNSLNKKDKKRSSLRKSTESKLRGMTKSRSYSDLASFEKEQKENDTKQKQNLTRVERLAQELDENGKYKDRDPNVLTPGLLDVTKKMETSSFTKLSTLTETGKTGWGKVSKNRKKIIAQSSDGEEQRIPDSQKVSMRLRRSENKRSVRRKISQIFKQSTPKITIENIQ